MRTVADTARWGADGRDGARRADRTLWCLASAAFVLAAATGAWMRFGMVYGLPFGLAFGDVRHAHSHLMFFSWVTPALMIFPLATSLRHDARRGGRALATAALVTGAATYLPFLLGGYGPMNVGGRQLPLSMMTSGLAGVTWYLFAGFHAWSTRRLPRTLPLRALDGAVVLLVVASGAATALGAVGMAGGGQSALMAGLIDLFLESFADGWFALALLALAFEAGGSHTHTSEARRGVVLLVGALLVRGAARLATDVGIGWAEGPATVAAAAAGVGLLLGVRPLLAPGSRAAAAWTVPLLFLAGKGLFELASAWPTLGAWSESRGLRIVLLHTYLLGAVTLGLAAAARDRLGRRWAPDATWLTVSVVLVLAALVPLTALWPRSWSGAWVLHAAAWTSLGPPLVVAAWLARGRPARDEAGEEGRAARA